jgi:hypothetical protein
MEQHGGQQEGDPSSAHAGAPSVPSADPGSELFDSEELRQLSGYARLAELLKEAHGVLRGMDLELPDRADFVRRLLVITAASRHDQDDAMRRLERFLRTVDGRGRTQTDPDCPV